MWNITLRLKGNVVNTHLDSASSAANGSLTCRRNSTPKSRIENTFWSRLNFYPPKSSRIQRYTEQNSKTNPTFTKPFLWTTVTSGYALVIVTEKTDCVVTHSTNQKHLQAVYLSVPCQILALMTKSKDFESSLFFPKLLPLFFPCFWNFWAQLCCVLHTVPSSQKFKKHDLFLWGWGRKWGQHSEKKMH